MIEIEVSNEQQRRLDRLESTCDKLFIFLEQEQGALEAKQDLERQLEIIQDR